MEPPKQRGAREEADQGKEVAGVICVRQREQSLKPPVCSCHGLNVQCPGMPYLAFLIKRLHSFPAISAAQARSASPSLSFPPTDLLPHFPFRTFPRALCRPREFVVTLVPRRGQGSLAFPLSGLDASSLFLHCLGRYLCPTRTCPCSISPASMDPLQTGPLLLQTSTHPLSLLVPASDGNWSWQTKFLSVTSWTSILVPQNKPRTFCLCCLPRRPRGLELRPTICHGTSYIGPIGARLADEIHSLILLRHSFVHMRAFDYYQSLLFLFNLSLFRSLRGLPDQYHSCPNLLGLIPELT